MLHIRFIISAFLVAALFIFQSAAIAQYDTILRGGTVYDGSGELPIVTDIAIKNDRVAGIGDLSSATALETIDVTGHAVSPGFINMLSWAAFSLIVDGRSQSNIRQGVTLEVFGEGRTLGPLNDTMRADEIEGQRSIKYPVEWRTMDEGLEALAARGISPNIASLVGATTVRVHVLGYEDRAPNADELEQMTSLVREAMEEGALGVGSSLIYAPAFYASTDELVELCKVAQEYDGLYMSHIRDEGNQFLESLDEFLEIGKRSGIRQELYHFKSKGKKNFPKLDQAIERIEAARAAGRPVSANMYTYAASSTGLYATVPPWVQEGGTSKFLERLKDPEIRARVIKEMNEPAIGWTNNLELAGGAENILLVSFGNPDMEEFVGETLAEVAASRGTSPADTILDLIIEANNSTGAVYFAMDEKNLAKKAALPWMSFGSDAMSVTNEGYFLRSQPHPRTYGNFARVLGRFVREEKVMPLEEAVRKLTSQPADTLRIRKRGRLKVGYFADIAVFDPKTVGDKATFQKPHQYAEGMVHVFVNGAAVLKDGEHTDARPGRVVRGPGWTGKDNN